jgi:general secretion pathway protein K
MLKKIFSDNQGIALITVILIVSILVAVAIELNRSSRADIYDAANISDGIKLMYIAKSGFYGAASLLVNAKNDDETTLRDDWANTETLSVQSKQLFTDGYFVVKVEDEAGKIPLNKLVSGNVYNPEIQKVLIRLLSQPEFGLDERKAEEIVDAIKDWIDGDSEVTGLGTESLYYATQDPPYEAKNAPLDCIEELLMIKGITKEIYAGGNGKPSLAQYVTVDSEGAININTAPNMVLRALSPAITAQLADKMDEYRRTEGKNLSSADWYNKEVSGMAGIQITLELTVKSNYFKIISTGKMNNMEQNIVSVVKRLPEKKSVQIVKWRQG